MFQNNDKPFPYVDSWNVELYQQWLIYHLGSNFYTLPSEERKERYLAAIKAKAPDSLIKWLMNTKKSKLLLGDVREIAVDRMIDSLLLGDQTDS